MDSSLVKPFACTYCNKKSYIRETGLDKHVLTQHPAFESHYQTGKSEAQRLNKRAIDAVQHTQHATRPNKRQLRDDCYVDSRPIYAGGIGKAQPGDIEPPVFDTDGSDNETQETFLPHHFRSRNSKAELGPKRETGMAYPVEVVDERVWAGDDLENVPEEDMHPFDPRQEGFNPFHPFRSGEDFKKAKFFIESRLSDSNITKFFNSGIGTAPSFQSPYKLHKLINEMEPALDKDSWFTGKATFVADKKNRDQLYHFRSLEEVIRFLIEQPFLRDHIHYAPVKHYSGDPTLPDTIRYYTEPYTGDYWAEQQAKLPEGHFLIFLILGSDETPFTVLGGDKKGWPLFLTLGNFYYSIRNLESAKAFVQLATLPCVPKKPGTKMGGISMKDWGGNKDDVLQETFGIILKDLPRLYEEGMKINCSDGKVRTGHPVLGGWIADYKEYGNLFQINADACVVCEIPKSAMGDNVIGPVRDTTTYKAKYSEFKKIRDKLTEGGLRRSELVNLRRDRDELLGWFKARRVHCADRILYNLPGLTQDAIWKPDILHTLYEGVAKYIFSWLKVFLTRAKRLQAFNYAWLTLPRYNEYSAPNKPFYQLTQRTGKEMRYALRCLLPVLSVALNAPLTAAQESEWKDILRCTRYIVDFMILCHFRQHSDETIRLLDEYLTKFHQLKEVFIPYRAGAAAEEAIDSAGRRNLSAEQIRNLQERTTHFNIPKFHLLAHFTDAIRRFGALHNWSTEFVEMLLKPFKAAYAASNKHSIGSQVVSAVAREHAIAIRENNLVDLARRIESHPELFDDKGKFWLSEIQNALMLFRNKSDKDEAAKMNRCGPKTKSESESAAFRATQGTRSSDSQSTRQSSDSQSTSTDIADSIPLFAETALLSRFRLSGNLPSKIGDAPDIWKRPTSVSSLAKFIENPALSSLILKQLNLQRRMSRQQVAHLALEMRSCVHIVADKFQTDSLEELKARCGVPGRFLPKGESACNEDVFFEDATGRVHGDFTRYLIGRLQALFVLWVPDESQWDHLEELRGDPDDYLNPVSHRLALVRLFQYDNDGVMDPDGGVGRVRYNMKEKYRVISISQILRPAQLIPDGLTALNQVQRAEAAFGWFVNNRIDDATWNKFYVQSG